MRVCKVPLSPKIERGNSPASSLSAASFSVLLAEESPGLRPRKSQAPGKGWCIPGPQNSLNTRQTYTRTHTDTKVNDRSSSSFNSRSLRETREPQPSRAAPFGAMCCLAATNLPSRPAPTVSARLGGRERPRPHFGDARYSSSSRSGPRNSEGHDGCAPGAHVSQHRLVAADLPGLGGFRAALLRLLFLPAGRRAFP